MSGAKKERAGKEKRAGDKEEKGNGTGQSKSQDEAERVLKIMQANRSDR